MRPVGFERGDFRFECVAPRAGQARSLRFLTMHDPNTLALRLLHGDADVAEAKPELFDVFDHRPGFRLASARSAGFTYVGLRNDHPLLARPEARRAIACALDRGALLAGKLGRFGVPATGPLPPSHWAYEGAVAREPYDPARARALLAAARASLPPDAPPLVLRCTNVRFALTTARAIAAMLAAVGLDVEVRPSELATLLADLRGGRYDLTLMTMPDLSDPWGLAVLFSSAARTTPENPRAGLNRWRYSNPDLDRVLEQGRTAAGPDARRPFYAEAQRILARDLPVVPLWHADVVYAAGPRVRSLRPRGDSQLDFLLALELAG